MYDLAQRLKKFRQNHGLTLEQVATRSGLTQGYLSKLERGVSEPSISSVLKLADAYDVSISELIGHTNDKSHQAVTIVRKEERSSLSQSNTKVKIEAIAEQRIIKKMNPFIIYPTQERDAKPLHDPHPGEEFILVLKGTIKIFIGNNSFVLNKGDSVYFDANIPHRIANQGKEQAEVLVVTA